MFLPYNLESLFNELLAINVALIVYLMKRKIIMPAEYKSALQTDLRITEIECLLFYGVPLNMV